MKRSLSLDTPRDVEQLQIDGWRRMAPAQKAAVVSGMTRSVYQVALAGLRRRHPDEPPRTHFPRLAVITLGPELAAVAYPEITALGLQ